MGCETLDTYLRHRLSQVSQPSPETSVNPSEFFLTLYVGHLSVSQIPSQTPIGFPDDALRYLSGPRTNERPRINCPTIFTKAWAIPCEDGGTVDPRIYTEQYDTEIHIGRLRVSAE